MKSFYSNLAKLSAAIIFLFAINTNAQNISDALRLGLPGLGVSARALGMGDSYIGLSDDASAAFYNPAGLGLLKRIELSGNLDYNKFQNSTSFFGQNSNESNTQTRLNRVSLAIPFPTYQGSLVFGISYHTSKDLTGALKFNGFNSGNNSMIQNLLDSDVPYDLYLTDTLNQTPINGNLNQSGSILSSGSVNNLAFTGAIEVYKNFFVGINFDYITGSYTSNNDYYEDDTHDIYQGETAAGEPQTRDFQTFYLNRILDWDIKGWDAKLGILYQMNNFARFGATVQFPKFHTIKEKFTVNGRSDFNTGTSYNLSTSKYSDQVEYDIVTPFELGAGFSVNITGLIVSAQATLIDYSQMEYKNAKGLSDEYVAGLNKDITTTLGSVINLNAGAEYTIPVIGLRLRGGFILQPSAYKNDPSEYDRKFVTAGIGFLVDQTVSVDIGFAHGWWKNYGDNYGTNVSRTFQDIKTNRVILGMTYRF